MAHPATSSSMKSALCGFVPAAMLLVNGPFDMSSILRARRYRSVDILYVVACVVAPSVASAQAGAITGVVSDSTGAPIAGVEVAIQGSGYPSRTDESGRFRISSPLGLVTLNARRIGFEPGSRQIQINGSSEATHVTIQLKSLPSVLKPVVVRTSKVEYTGRLAGYYRRLENQNAGYFISRAQIDRENPRTLSQLLTHAPGINATRMRGGGSGVRMRGRNCW